MLKLLCRIFSLPNKSNGILRGVVLKSLKSGQGSSRNRVSFSNRTLFPADIPKLKKSDRPLLSTPPAFYTLHSIIHSSLQAGTAGKWISDVTFTARGSISFWSKVSECKLE